MKIKTIKKVITKKMNDWLESISNEELRQKVKDNLLVSGGSVASMLLKEPINDFDVYIQDMDVLIENAYLEVAAQKLGYKSVLELKKKLSIKP